MQRESKIVISLALFICLLTGAYVSAAPRLTLPETVFNFGYAPQNSKICHDFWLISTGDQTLKIEKVTPGCSCTKAPLERDVLNPGDSTRLEIIFSTKTYRDRVAKSPSIKTNEGTSEKRIQILATVVSRPDSTYPIVIQPYKLDVSQKTNKTIDRIEFSIRNVSDQNLNLKTVSSASDYFDLDLPSSIKPGAVEKCRLSLHKSALGKSFEKSFTIQLSDENGTRFTIPVKRTLGDNEKSATASR